MNITNGCYQKCTLQNARSAIRISPFYKNPDIAVSGAGSGVVLSLQSALFSKKPLMKPGMALESRNH